MEEPWGKHNTYFHNLDGLRFFAFLGVFFAHSFYSEIAEIKNSEFYQLILDVAIRGVYGVKFFFVLSGFLITWLLLSEKKRNSKINITAFYKRRILRIWPLYFLVVTIGFVVVPFLMNQLGEVYHEKSNVVGYLLFINNFMEPPSTAVLGVLWSIAVEEQFYLLWPLLLAFIPFKRLPVLFGVLVLISYLFIWSNPLAMTNTLYYVADLVIGSWLAYHVHRESSFLNFFLNLPKTVLITIYIAGFISVLLSVKLTENFTIATAQLYYALFFAFIILDQTSGKNSFYQMSKSRFLTYWGKRTYGLYMLHLIVIYSVGRLFREFYTKTMFDVLVLETIVTFVLSLVVAYLSFRFFEMPFLRLKDNR